MRNRSDRSLLRAGTLAVIGAVGAIAFTGAAWAGDDDGGSKAFYSSPGPGRYQEQAAPETSTSAASNSAATAAIGTGAYEGYRTQPGDEATPVRHKSHHHHPVVSQ